MLKIAIVDDGVGCVPTLIKLRQSICANYLCILWEDKRWLGNLNASGLFSVANKSVALAESQNCNAVVFSSVALANKCVKTLSFTSNLDLFGCDAPILHAGAYTASNVLVVGDKCVVDGALSRGVLGCAMPNFSALAEEGNDKKIVQYVDSCLSPYFGEFDCIAIANSSMNMYKNCFQRVFPNVQVFDSLEGVARKMRKKYKNGGKDEGLVTFVSSKMDNLQEKYGIFLQ